MFPLQTSRKVLVKCMKVGTNFFAFTHISPRLKIKSKQWKVLATIEEQNMKETMKETPITLDPLPL